MALFDEIILSKRNRGRSSIFSGRSMTDFLSDTSNHLWRTASATSFGGGSRSQNSMSGDYSRLVSRGLWPGISLFVSRANQGIKLQHRRSLIIV